MACWYWIIVLGLGVANLLSAQPLPQLTSHYPTVRILLPTDEETVSLELWGKYALYDLDNHRSICATIFPHELTWQTIGASLICDKPLPFWSSIRLIPSDKKPSFFCVNKIAYEGVLELRVVNNRLCIINEIDFESLVKTILLRYESHHLEQEALEALAITLRTNLYAILEEHAGENSLWDIEMACIDYEGRILPTSTRDFAKTRAANITKGLILLWQDRPFRALSTEDSGGITAPSTLIENIGLTPPPVCLPVLTRWESKPDRQWQYQIPKEDFLLLFGIDSLCRIDTAGTSNQSRVVACLLFDQTGNKTILPFKQLNATLDGIKSNRFTVNLDETSNTIFFEGAGEGLGIGLCLYGANLFAQQGWRAPLILQTFFPNSSLARLRPPL